MRALAAAALLLAAGCARRHPCAFLAESYDALPLLKALPKDRVHELRVLYLEDDRVPGLDADGRAALYRRVEALTPRWLGYRVKLREVGARGLKEEFARPDAPFRDREEAACIRAVSFDPLSELGEAVVADMVGSEYAARGPQVFARLFPETAGRDADAVRRLAVERFMSLQRSLSAIRTAEGPLIASPESRAMYSFLHWSAYLRAAREADFYLTNAALLVPDNDMPVYVLARGGLTTGFVNNAPGSPYGAVGMVTLLPFLSGEPLLDPAARPTTEAENLDAAATMWLHELGHFLNRYGEMYGESGCVHVASEGLEYFQWHRAIRMADNRCSRLPGVVPKY